MNLEPTFTKDNFVYVPKKKGFLCYRRTKLEKPICLGQNKGLQHVHVHNESIWKMQEFFRPQNRKFFKLINRTFDWEGVV